MINIVENFLDVNYQNFIESLITEQKLPVFYNPNTIYLSIQDSLLKDKNTKDTPQFSHNFVVDGNVNSEYWTQFLPITYFAMAKCGVGNGMKLNRVKLNLQLKDNSLLDGQYNVPHIDQEKKGITGIYYVNDCDGSTVFFDKSDNKLTVIKEIQAKKGMFVYFDSNIYHAGKPSKQTDYKSVINFNWQ